MGVYLYPNNTETELKNAYIGEYPERWQPWANTVAYYPLTSTTTVNDLSGNGYTLSTHDTLPTFWIYQWVDCASFNSNSLKTSSVNPWAYWNYFTVSLWIYSTSNWDRVPICNYYAQIEWWPIWYNWGIRSHSSWSSIFKLMWGSNPTFNLNSGTTWWNHLLFIWDNWNLITYKNGVQQGTGTIGSVNNNGTLTIWAWWDDWEAHEWHGCFWYFKWWISEVIIEDKVRTAREIADYYNLTKSNYGL